MTDRTNIYFDFEFIDDGREIVPISLGMCTSLEHGLEVGHGSAWNELYLEYVFDPARADDWVREHVFPHLESHPSGCIGSGYKPLGCIGNGFTRARAARDIQNWVAKVCGDTKPQFWGHGPAYEFVCLVQHFGTKEQLPKGWPIRPRCLEQLADHLGIAQEAFPKQPEDAHNALANAKWNRSLHAYLKSRDD